MISFQTVTEEPISKCISYNGNILAPKCCKVLFQIALALRIHLRVTVGKVCKYGVFSDLYFPVLSPKAPQKKFHFSRSEYNSMQPMLYSSKIIG